MAKTLNLQGLIIYDFKEDEEKFVVKIGSPAKPKECPYCKSVEIKKHAKGKERTIRHGVNINNKLIFLKYTGKRYKCRECRRTWTKAPPEWLVQGRKRSSEICRIQALKTLQITSFAETSRRSGLSYSVLKSILENKVNNTMLLNLPDTGYITIDVDEHKQVKKRFVTTITMIKPNSQLLGLLPNKTNKSLKQWFEENWTQDQRERVTEICIDMATSWKYVFYKIFPNTKIVIDEFHVVAYFNEMIAKEYKLKAATMPKKIKDELPYRSKGKGIVKKLYEGGKY